MSEQANTTIPETTKPADKAWRAFRTLPLWAQIVIAIIGLVVLGAGFSTTETKTVTKYRTPSAAKIKAARAELADLEQQVADESKRLDATRASLNRAQRQLGSAKKEIAKRTFQGDGTYLVGTDIAPGLYRAAPSPGCYWARLRDLNDGVDSIIANDNTDGPAVMTVSRGDFAVQVSGCSDFRRS